MNKEELAHRFVFYLLKEKEFFKRRDTHTHTIIKFKPFHVRFHINTGIKKKLTHTHTHIHVFFYKFFGIIQGCMGK